MYHRTPSLCEYLLVAQHRVLVELYTRELGSRWVLSSFESLADQVRLDSLACTLLLADVYDKIAFPSDVSEP